MKGHAFSKDTAPSLDITEPSTEVTVEIDHHRKVLYVHLEGYTCLRICRIPGKIKVIPDLDEEDRGFLMELLRQELDRCNDAHEEDAVVDILEVIKKIDLQEYNNLTREDNPT